MRSRTKLRILTACAVVALVGGLAAMGPGRKDVETTVKTDKGRVAGAASTVADGVLVFKGIPYGAPPVGELRWKPPQPVAEWKGVRDATKFSPVCMQPRQEGKRTPNNRSVDMPDSPPISEDCLYLNVWTPAKTRGDKLPVMVWIYGGAYYEGAGSNDLYRGDNLAAKGVVVVTGNHRIGPLGFMAHPELTAESPHHASGNYALTDVIAQLRWVKENIARFGGDPDNVTVFGESAGSSIASAMIASPEAAGLFQRAIPESGTWMGLNMGAMPTREATEARTIAAADQKWGDHSLAKLRSLPAEEISDTAQLREGMIIDGWIAPEDFTAIMARGAQNPVDILTGSNRDEGSFQGGGPGGAMTAARWKDSAQQRWGDLAELGLAAYPPTDDAAAAGYGGRLFADNMSYMMSWIAERQKAKGRSAWAYRFQHVPPYAEGTRDLGVCHTCEIRYVFGNLAAPGIVPDLASGEIASTRPVDKQVSEIVQGYWVNFARTGDPNGPGLPAWPRIESADAGPRMHLDETPAVEETLTPAKAALFHAQLDKLVAGLAK